MNARLPVRGLLKGCFLILFLAEICLSQTPFQVSNPKHQEWPQSEALLIYDCEARNLAEQFNLPRVPRAVFTVVLGAEENSVDMNTKELRLKKWDKYLYAEGVLRLTFDQILSSESKMRLARRAVAESEATVNSRSITRSSGNSRTVP